jgi:hypothetical protein
VQIADMFFRFFIAITFKQTTRLRSINIPKTWKLEAMKDVHTK